MSEMKRTWIEGVEYSYDANEEYEKAGHVYCKTCHERKDGKILEFFGGKMICRVSCHCDKQREEKEAERQKQLEIERLKSSCFSSRVEWEYSFENYKGEENQSLIIAKNFVKDYEQMKKENVGLLFYGSVGSGKTYLACSIANALIEQYQITVKIRNFSQIMNEMQKCGFDFDKNAYIESLVNNMEDLPIFPKDYKYEVIKATKKQFSILKKLMNESSVDTIINACDAGREGESIFRQVYLEATCKKKVERLWISSMEDSAIKE